MYQGVMSEEILIILSQNGFRKTPFFSTTIMQYQIETMIALQLLK
jgi:hypothetical protein